MSSGLPPADGAGTERPGTVVRSGYDGQLTAGNDGIVHCSPCGASTPAGQLIVDHIDRPSPTGALDVADMHLVLGARCPSCDRKGSLVVGFGPNAGEADLAVLDDLSPATLGRAWTEVRPVT